MAKSVPFTKEQIQEIIKRYPTPFHIYDEAAIRRNARELLKAGGVRLSFLSLGFTKS